LLPLLLPASLLAGLKHHPFPSPLAGWRSIGNDEPRMGREFRKRACEKESGSKLHALQSFAPNTSDRKSAKE